MIITIDTSKDTEQDILKAINFLSSLVNPQSLVGQYQQYQESSAQPDITPQAGDAFTQMFDNPVPTDQVVQDSTEEMHKVVEDNKENPPKIVYYTW